MASAPVMWLALAATLLAPSRLQVSTAKGLTVVPLLQRGGEGPLVPLALLARATGGTVQRTDDWFRFDSPAGMFRFLAGTAVMTINDSVRALPAASYRRGDSIYVSLAFVAEVLADPARRRWRWTPGSAALVEGPTPSPLLATAEPATRSRTPDTRATPSASASGLRATHTVTIDPGHGGTDSGNPGMFFPTGVKEKDVTLAVGRKLRDELQSRGVKVIMTRTTDTLINLYHRAPRYCREGCDLFVSLHVNSLDRRPGFTRVRGFETYFLAEARTTDEARVARMENDAIRFQVADDTEQHTGLDFIFKDLTVNEFLRESARAAELVQSRLREVHNGGDKGQKQAGFAVLTTAKRPAILVEMGYSTNPDDARLMSGRTGQQALAEAIADAVVQYLREYEQKTGTTQ